MLWPLPHGQCWRRSLGATFHNTPNPANRSPAGRVWVFSYRGAGIRTRDLLLPKQARYRTAPHPVETPLQASRVCLLL
jgi:hypothetical protein